MVLATRGLLFSIHALERRHGRPVSLDELATSVGVPHDELKHLWAHVRAELAAGHIVSRNSAYSLTPAGRLALEREPPDNDAA